MRKGLVALAAAALTVGPAGTAHAYEEAIDVNDTGVICLNFATGERADEHLEFEWWETEDGGYWEVVLIECPPWHDMVPEGYCLPDYPWEGEPDPNCDLAGGN